MIRKLQMFVRPDAHAEYQRRHNPIWKELEDALISTASAATRSSLTRKPANSSLTPRLKRGTLAGHRADRSLSALVAYMRTHADQSGQEPQIHRTPRSLHIENHDR